MIFQQYINNNEYKLLACIKIPQSYEKIVLLVPGFSHSKSDMDYFLTNLSNELYRKNFMTVQIDLYGHGDSYGNFCDLTIDRIIENLKLVIKWIEKEYDEKILVFTRGIYGNLLYDKVLAQFYLKSIILNPVLLCLTELNYIYQMLNNYFILNNSEIIEFADFYSSLANKEKNMLLNYVSALGAEIRNLLGMKVNIKLLLQLIEFCKKNKIQTNGKNRIIFSNSTNCLYMGADDKILEDYSHAFPRDPEWNEFIIDRLCKEINILSET